MSRKPVADFLILALVAGFSAFMPASFALADANCYSASRAATVLRPYGLQKEDFGTSGNLCDSKSDLVKLLTAFDFLERLKFNAPLFGGLSAPGFLSTAYLDFVQSNIREIEYHPNLGCDAQDVCVVADTTLAGHMRLGRSFFDESLVERATTLVHETRHTIGDGYPHVDCIKGVFSQSTASCDDAFSSGGAYAVEVEFNARIYHSATNVSALLRSIARENAVEGLRSRFNDEEAATTPIETAVLVADDGQVALFDGEQLAQPAVKLQPRSLIIAGAATDEDDGNGDGAVTVLPGDRTSRASTFNVHTHTSEERNSFANSGATPLDSIYRWLLPENRRAIKDAMIFQSFEVVLYDSTVAVAATDARNSPRLVSLAGISRPSLVTYAPFCAEYDRLNAPAITIRGDDNSVYFVDPRSSTFRKSSCRFPVGLKEIVRLNGKRYGLANDGRLVFVSGMNAMSDVPAARGRKFGTLKKMASPTFASYFP